MDKIFSEIQNIAHIAISKIDSLNWANRLSLILSLLATIIACRVAHKQNKQTHSAEPLKKINHCKRFFRYISRYLYNILYVGILLMLWLYIILNWEKCISMRFFSQFNGNNILFLVGIVLVILPFYDIEGNGVKLHKKGIQAVKEQAQDARYEFQLEQREKGIDMAASKISEESNGGDEER